MKNSLFLNKTYSRAELKGLMESVLFVNGKSVPFQKLSEIFDMNRSEMGELIDEMNRDYGERQSGFGIIQVGGGFQLVSNPQYKDEMMELYGKRNENALTKSMLETLAIIAYKQPISKEDVDKIRGVSSTRSINSLLGYKLISISGATDGIVKSPLYSVTSRFFEMFRINSLDDLPNIETIDWNEYGTDEDDSFETDDEEELDLTMKKSE